MPFAAALSQHPLPTHAVGEVVGQVLDELGEAPDAALVFVTTAFAGALEDIAATIRATLAPAALVGSSASSVLANGQEVEQEAAIALFAFRRPAGHGTTSPPRAIAFHAEQEGDGWSVAVDAAAIDGPATLVLLADPFTFPVEAVVDDLVGRHPGVTVVGGMASSASGPGGNRLVADREVLQSGAVALVIPHDVPARPVVSQGCRPVGDPLVVTRANGHMIDEIAGMAALDRVLQIAEQAHPDDRRSMAHALQIGLVLDERKPEPDRGDVLVRPVLGADRERRSVAVGADVAVGSTVQFQVRDAASADEDLRLLLADADARAALVFTCIGRGRELFHELDHDAGVVAEALDGGPVAGMFCEGEIGPICGRHVIHGMAATVLLLDDPP